MASPLILTSVDSSVAMTMSWLLVGTLVLGSRRFSSSVFLRHCYQLGWRFQLFPGERTRATTGDAVFSGRLDGGGNWENYVVSVWRLPDPERVIK